MKRTLSIREQPYPSTRVDLAGRLELVEPIKPLSPFELRIRMLERSKGEKMGPLGKSAGISHATIRKWIEASYEPDGFNPQYNELRKLADYCGVTVEWLMDTGPVQEVPLWAPTVADLGVIRERLRKRNYPIAAIDDVLFNSRFTGLTNIQDLFDFCEAELQQQGLSPRFAVSSSEEGELGGTAPPDGSGAGRKKGKAK
jgi:transcriptional regulator with XRE-family HTH domain